jgi:hypothetical protein
VLPHLRNRKKECWFCPCCRCATCGGSDFDPASDGDTTTQEGIVDGGETPCIEGM